MSRPGLHGVIDWLRRRALADVPCGELLERFRAAQEAAPFDKAPMAEAAFAELVHRHGPKVYAVCRRILGDHQLAEDAFQAVFVVLSRKAGTIRPAAAVGGFLHGVARKAALEAFAVSRRRPETLVAHVPERPAAGCSGPAADELAMLDEEIANLSETYRATVVLCELDGVSRSNAAEQLGISEGTLSSRLAAARKQLRNRLAKRGVSLSAGMLTAWAESAQASVPPSLTAAAVQSTASVMTPAVLSIVQGVLQMMVLAKLKGATILAATLVLSLGLGLSAANHGLLALPSNDIATDAQPPNPPPIAVNDAKPRTDTHGDPLPPGVIARLGTLRQRAADSHVAVSADGKDIITVGNAMTVRIWDAATGKLRSQKQLSDSRRPSTFLSADGAFLLSDSWHPDKGRGLVVWDVAQGQALHAQQLTKESWIDGAAFAPSNRQVAIVESSRKSGDRYFIRIWDLKTDTMRTLNEHKKRSNNNYFQAAVQYSPDGKYLVDVPGERLMRCWDTSTDKLLWERPFVSDHAYYCISPDSKFIVGRSLIGRLDIATGKEVAWETKPPAAAFPLKFSPDGRHLAFINQEHNAVIIWDMVAGQKTLELRSQSGYSLIPHPYNLPTDFAFTPDGAGYIWRPDVIQRWNLADGKPVFPDSRMWGHTSAVSKIVFSPDGTMLASSGASDHVLMWDIAAASPRFSIPGHFNYLVGFTPNGRHYLAHHYDKTDGMGIWDVGSGKLNGFLEWNVKNQFLGNSRNKELRISADGKKLTVLVGKNGGSNDECLLTTWDLDTHARTRLDDVPWGRDSVLLPDGQSVVTFDSRAGAIVARSLDAAEPRWQLPLDRPDGGNWFIFERQLELSRDGRLVASHVEFVAPQSQARKRDGIRLIDTGTGRQIMKVDVDGSPLLALSPDNRLLAVAAADGVRFWEIASQKQAGFIPGPNQKESSRPEAFASALAFSPDSRKLATGHSDCTILLWDATFYGAAPSGPITAAERDMLWAALAGADAEKAQAALWRYVGDPQATVAFLRKHLSSETATPSKVIDPLVRDLDNDDFKRRSAADEQLRRLGESAEPGLRKALNGNISLEAKRRVETLLAALEVTMPLTNERLRMIRSVHILEQIASPESRQFLAQLASGEYASWFTRAADETAKRIKTP